VALRKISRRKPCPKNRIEEHIEKSVVGVARRKLPDTHKLFKT
jgi:hypothetical protein